MKEYVLDLPPAAGAPAPIAAAAEARPPRNWRPLLLLLVVEPLALGALYLALTASPLPPDGRDATGPATIAAFAFPAPPADASADAAMQAPPPNRIAFERGRYVVDLHGADLSETVELLRKVTRATVRGGDVLNGNAARLSRQLVAATPVEAWQAVLGDVASFAISCLPQGCTVRFVPLASPGDVRAPTLASLGVAMAPEVLASPPEPVAAQATPAPNAETNGNGPASSEN
jgi:hypothetical protein